MEYITAKEAAEKWGYTEATIRNWCTSGKIFVLCTPVKKGGHWQIPKDAECPKPIKAKA